jgi:CHAD domain-containing protein
MNPLKEHLIRYYEHLDADLHFVFMEIQQSVTKGNLHRFRVIIKRIKAFLRLLQHLDPYFPIKSSLEDLQPLFNQAGHLRDFQIEYQLLAKEEKRLDMPAKSSAEIHREMHRQRLVFDQFEQEYSLAPIRELNSTVQSHIRHLPEEQLSNRINGYFHHRLGALSYLSEKGQEDKSVLHDLRSGIKEVVYNLQLLDTILPDKSISMDLLAPLETLQHQLGRWHDHIITRKEIQHLQHQPKKLKHQLKEDERQLLLQIQPELQKIPHLVGELLMEIQQAIPPTPSQSG